MPPSASDALTPGCRRVKNEVGPADTALDLLGQTVPDAPSASSETTQLLHSLQTSTRCTGETSAAIRRVVLK